MNAQFALLFFALFFIIPNRSQEQRKQELCHKYGNVLAKCHSKVRPITGGSRLTMAEGREFPHMALLGYVETGEDYRQWQCGGSLISERFVLTAAQCFRTGRPPNVVRLGELNYETDADDARPEEFNITQIFVHPNYTHSTMYNDIALLRLDRDVKFSDYVRPICLNTSPEIKEQLSIVTGWGALGIGLRQSERLKKVIMPIVSIDNCKKIFDGYKMYPFGIDEGSQMCTGVEKENADACAGDAGGPLQIEMECSDGPRAYLQVGITSFGTPHCGIIGEASGYTKVSNYSDWIRGIVWPI